MEGTYEILLGSRAVGKVQVTKQGLYYRFSGRCTLSEGEVCRLQVSCGNVWENLGVLIPVEGGFGVEKKLPVRRFGEGIPSFQILGKQPQPAGKFVPIYPEEPFAYLARLKDAFLATQNGQVGIVIRE